jgi:predicted HicB family RNase H-like nuclease
MKQLAQVSYRSAPERDLETFAEELQRHGIECQAKKDSSIQVRIKEDVGTEANFQAALDCGVQIRHMARVEMTLKEVFSTRSANQWHPDGMMKERIYAGL